MSERQRHKVSVIIPCHNEAENIAGVIKGFRKPMLAKEAFDFELIVVANACTDNTAEIARKAGVQVIDEPQKGKGNAMRAGFAAVNSKSEYVVMIDGDGTYRPEEVLRLLEPLVSNFCTVVVGSRLGGKIHGDAMRPVNRGGNWIYTHLVRAIYKLNVTDVLSGYFAWRRSVIKELAPQLNAHGFAIEMEMITKMSRMGCEVYSVPISYHQRGGVSNLRPLHDGIRIMQAFFRNLGWQPRVKGELEEET